MLIVCLSSVDVDKVVKHCENLLCRSNNKFKCLAAYGQRAKRTLQVKNNFRKMSIVQGFLSFFSKFKILFIFYKKDQLLNGVDILVATVPCLLRLMKNPLHLFNKKRITTLVFDEIDSMCDRFGSENVDLIYKTFHTEAKKIQVRK